MHWGRLDKYLAGTKLQKNGRESTCVSDFQNPKDEDSCLELDMMSVYMKFLERLFWLFLSTSYLWDVESWSALVSLLWDSSTLGTASVLIDLLGDLLCREDRNLKAYSFNVAAIDASAVTVGKEIIEYGTAPASFETMFGLLAKVSTISGPNFKSIILHKMQTMHKARVVAKTGLLYCAVWRFFARYQRKSQITQAVTATALVL